MAPLLSGYARVSTDQQDLSAQRAALSLLGVSSERTYVDHGLSGTNRQRPGLREALAACRAGDTLVVTKLDRLARSLPDARDILADITRRDVKLSIGGSVHDPTDPVGRLLFTCWQWSPSSSLTSSGCAPQKACASPRPKGACAASSPSSIRVRRRTSSRYIAPLSTAPPSSPTCLASRGPRSTAPSNATPDNNAARPPADQQTVSRGSGSMTGTWTTAASGNVLLA
ncbi:MAG: hypothetical protein QOI98_3220 [Solirubrobacteraceae bacterium]|nr:hypothetical protein [Solirubrobacteraceae bacterium]